MNKKYELQNSALKGLNQNLFSLLILRGLAGFGKTYNTKKFLDKNNTDYIIIDSYTTPLKFFQLLYENRNKQVIVFDDVEGIVDNKIKSMLKSACWSVHNNRNVSYHSSTLKDFPSSFQIKANIILICNDVPKGFNSIINRGEKIEFMFSFKEKIEIFQSLVGEKIEQEVLDYVKKFCNNATENLSIRTLEILSSYMRAGEDWVLHADEMLKTDERFQLVIQAVKGNITNEEWVSKTGLTIRTLQRYKQKLGESCCLNIENDKTTSDITF